MKHVILTNPRETGYFYSAQREFEDEIARLTGAATYAVPERHLPLALARRLAHGTRYGRFRRFIPQRSLDDLRADVLWVVLMGPENFQLDLYKDWDRRCGTKILYLFDTFEAQLPVLRRVLDAVDWDVVITSFHDAVPMLEASTQRKWHAVSQGVRLERFAPRRADERVIDFSAYGRRQQAVHEAVGAFCEDRGLYYDFTSGTAAPDVPPRELGRIHAWHLTRSAFTFCWPVEVTHPARAGTLSPVTCRWFEAAASGAVMIGREPHDPRFRQLFGDDLVVPCDPSGSRRQLMEFFEDLQSRRTDLIERALARRQSLQSRWSWASRVDEILEIAGCGSLSDGLHGAVSPPSVVTVGATHGD